MDIKKVASELSIIERDVLSSLKDGKARNPAEISSESRVNIDSVRRAIGWLGEKKLADVREEKGKKYMLTSEGRRIIEKGLPETRMINALEDAKGKAPFKELMEKSMLDSREFNAALGINKKRAFVVMSGGFIGLTDVPRGDVEKQDKKLIGILEKIAGKDALSQWEMSSVKELLKRGELVTEREVVERSVSINPNGLKALEVLSKGVAERGYNIEGKVPKIYIGKKHPYIQFLLQVRRKLTELGFKEMPVPQIVQEFYNFDVLFQPQNHPARTWSDTYQLKSPQYGKLPAKKIVSAVKNAHENGGKTGSIGWRYDWSERIASRLMPAAHGTAGSAMQLVNGVEIPGKYFAVARCYRPDVVDATHLNEFNQMEGFIVDESFSFRHLLGMLGQFAIEIAGAEKVKFYPDYYPFTEPSVQLSALHPEMGWIEFGGAGIFRPEMTEPLGVKAPVLAWGLGIDRLAMFKLGISDIRHLFSNDLQWLRESKMVKVD